MKPNRRYSLNEYGKRNRVLKALGYASYAAYLASDLWRTIRARVLQRDGHVCRGCGGRANQAHHRNYRSDVLAGVNDVHIVSMCNDCHEEIEFDGDRKVSTRTANKKLKERRRSRRK